MFKPFTRRRAACIAVVVAIAMAALSGRSGATSIDPAPAESTHQLQSASSAANTGTPINQIRATYYAGSTVYSAPVMFDGALTTPNVTRVQASNGFYYAVLSFKGKYLAVDETNGAVFNTNGALYGDTSQWTLEKAIELIELYHWMMKWSEFFLEALMLFLLIFGLLIIILFILWRAFFGGRSNDPLDMWRDRERGKPNESTQWSNRWGVVLYDYVPFHDEAGYYHPGLLPDLRWLEQHDPRFGGLREDLRFGGDLGRYLDRGVLPAHVAALG